MTNPPFWFRSFTKIMPKFLKWPTILALIGIAFTGWVWIEYTLEVFLVFALIVVYILFNPFSPIYLIFNFGGGDTSIDKIKEVEPKDAINGDKVKGLSLKREQLNIRKDQDSC